MTGVTSAPAARTSELADAQIQAIASAQAGMISRHQALGAGLTKGHVEWLLHAQRWQRVHTGVFATFTGELTFESRLWAAILRAGRGAVASHRTAAYLDGVCDDPGPVIELTVPADRHIRNSIAGVRIHYAHRLARTRHPARLPPRTRTEDTILDLIDTTRHARDVEGWVTNACQRRRTKPSKLAEALGRRKKIRWRAMLESMLTEVAAGAESPLELQHLRRVERAHGLPAGRRQRRVTGQRVIWVDVDHDEFTLRIELDGRTGHADEGPFRDRRRDNRTTAEGRATLRYGHADIFGDPCGVASEQARVLGARGWTGTLQQCGSRCTAVVS